MFRILKRKLQLCWSFTTVFVFVFVAVTALQNHLTLWALRYFAGTRLCVACRNFYPNWVSLVGCVKAKAEAAAKNLNFLTNIVTKRFKKPHSDRKFYFINVYVKTRNPKWSFSNYLTGCFFFVSGSANNIAFSTFLCQVVVETSQRCYTFDMLNISLLYR